MEDQEILVRTLDVVGLVLVNVQERVLPLVLGHAQRDVAVVPALVRECAVEVAAEAALTIVLHLAEDVVEDVLVVINSNKLIYND